MQDLLNNLAGFIKWLALLCMCLLTTFLSGLVTASLSFVQINIIGGMPPYGVIDWLQKIAVRRNKILSTTSYSLCIICFFTYLFCNEVGKIGSIIFLLQSVGHTFPFKLYVSMRRSL